MIIRLPHITPINTLDLPCDFEERVKESFVEVYGNDSKRIYR